MFGESLSFFDNFNLIILVDVQLQENGKLISCVVFLRGLYLV